MDPDLKSNLPADLKEGHKPEDHNPLKRPLDAEEEEDDDDDEVEVFVDPRSDLEIILLDEAIGRMVSNFKHDSKLLQLLHDILKSLKNDDTGGGFSDAVRRVLEYELFIKELYKESSSEDGWIFLNNVRGFGVTTQNRVNLFGGKTEKLISVIRNDSYFIQFLKAEEALKVEDPDLLLRVVVGILVVYCISYEDLKAMSKQIKRPETEVWVSGPIPEFVFHNFGI